MFHCQSPFVKSCHCFCINSLAILIISELRARSNLRQRPISNFKFATSIYRLKVRPVYRRFASTQTSFIADVIFRNVVWQIFNNFNQIEKERNDEADSDSHCRTPEQDQFVKKIIGVNI
jgi:hypothetical protein